MYSSNAEREVNTHLKSLLIEESSLIMRACQISLLPTSIFTWMAKRRNDQALRRTRSDIENIRQWQEHRKEMP